MTAVDAGGGTSGLAEFLAKHPEYAQATNLTSGPKPLAPDGGTLASDYSYQPPFPGISPNQLLDPSAIQQYQPPGPKTPQYLEGAQYAIANLLPEELLDLQDNLVKAGLLGATAYRKGDPTDPATLDAYAKLLGHANVTGDDDKTTLNRLLLQPLTKATTPRVPLTVQLTNPNDIRDIVHQVGDSLYGGSLPESTRESIVNAVQASERAAQEQAYAMGDAGGSMTLPEGIGPDGNVTSIGLQSLTARTVRKEHPNEVGAGQFASAFDAIMSEVASNPSGYQSRSYSGLS